MDVLARLRCPTTRWTLAVKSAAFAILATPGVVLSPAAAAPLDPMNAFLAMNPQERSQAVECLGEAIYYEAGFESREGQLAVAQVVLNRVRDPHYPHSVCGVIYEGWERDTGCQFSFACDGSLARRPPTADQARQAREVAEEALAGETVADVGDATHYHTDYVDPYWAPTLDKVATVGTHIFYETPRKLMARSRVPYKGGEVAVRSEVRAG